MITRRNVDPTSTLIWHPENCFDVWLPEEDVDAICVAQALANGALVMNGTGAFDPANANTPIFLPHPTILCFSLSVGTDSFTYAIKGADHFGQELTRTATKGAGANTKWSTGLHSVNTCWSRIDSITISNFSGTGNVEVGYGYGTSSALVPRLPLPWRSNNYGNYSGGAQITDIAGVKFVDQGGGTIVPAPPSVLTMGALADSNRVLPVTFGTYTAAPTLPMQFRVAYKPEFFRTLR